MTARASCMQAYPAETHHERERFSGFLSGPEQGGDVYPFRAIAEGGLRCAVDILQPPIDIHM